MDNDPIAADPAPDGEVAVEVVEGEAGRAPTTEALTRLEADLAELEAELADLEAGDGSDG